jgi:hypothetical protein
MVNCVAFWKHFKKQNIELSPSHNRYDDKILFVVGGPKIFFHRFKPFNPAEVKCVKCQLVYNISIVAISSMQIFN